MASLKLLLGMIPSTSKIEQAEKALITEFEKLHVFAGSDQLAKYNELNRLVNSSDFVQKKKYAPPCGGFILLANLLEKNIISIDDIQNII